MKNISDLLLSWFGGLVILYLAASFQSSPGYMDAEYYYGGGLLLQQGWGFKEPYIWNYLNDPQSLPVPSHTYWMPLASLIAFLGMKITRVESFETARLPFIVLSSFISPLTYWLGYRISKKRFIALFAAFLAWFPMFYLAYLPTTDTFGLYMILGTFWIVMASEITGMRRWKAFGAGMLCGLIHLARADGLFWMLLFLVFLLSDKSMAKRHGNFDYWKILLFLMGYGLVMSGWYGRNWMEYDTFFPPGNQRALFLRTYNDLFRYPSTDLNFGYLFQDGLKPILRDRLFAAGQNLLNLMAVQLQILLVPLLIFGYWKRRREPIVMAASFAWLTMFGLMTVVFPFAGWRGGFFHTSAAFQPLVWCLAAEGFVEFVGWGVKKRGWNALAATRVFSIFLLGFMFCLTFYVYWQRVIGNDVRKLAWDETLQRQHAICLSIKPIVKSVRTEDAVVMTNDPIGFYLKCEIPSVSVPVGGEKSVKLVAQRYGVEYLVLEKDHPPELSAYFLAPHSTTLLTLVDDQEEWKIYKIDETP